MLSLRHITIYTGGANTSHTLGNITTAADCEQSEEDYNLAEHHSYVLEITRVLAEGLDINQN